jgi:hypothetical protein
MVPARGLIGFITFAALAAVCAGCAAHTNERVRTNVPMDVQPAVTQKVVVLARAVPDHHLLYPEDGAAHEAVRRVVRCSPGATLVTDSGPRDRRAENKASDDAWRAAKGDKAAAERLQEARAAASRAADEEALRAARDAGADRACVVEFRSAGAEFAITLLPIPGWSLNDNFLYTARAFDVESGRKILETQRARSHGGLFSIYRPDLPRDLERALREDLAPVLPPPKAPNGTKKSAAPFAGIDLVAFIFD